MFQYLYGHPIKMTVYGHAISYGTIGRFDQNTLEISYQMFARNGRCWDSRCFCFQNSTPGNEFIVNYRKICDIRDEKTVNQEY